MKRIIVLLLAICILVPPVIAKAQAWPTRPVRLIVPYPAGGNADIVERESAVWAPVVRKLNAMPK
jgi:tripartite-type tricarboxylate transporter receptor subunit TctC